MKESAQIALSYLRSHGAELELPVGDLKDRGVHVHVPAGAVPKDGPSAGVTMTTALASLLSGRPVRTDVAMTGEVSLTGRVLPIGGVKQKLLAAHRAGITTVLIPKRNEPDLDDVPGRGAREAGRPPGQRRPRGARAGARARAGPAGRGGGRLDGRIPRPQLAPGSPSCGTAPGAAVCAPGSPAAGNTSVAARSQMKLGSSAGPPLTGAGAGDRGGRAARGGRGGRRRIAAEDQAGRA